MPDLIPENESQKKEERPVSDFIQESIKERPVSRKRLLRRTLITVSMALVFGLIACLTIAFLTPVISRLIKTDQEEPVTQVSFPEQYEEILPEDMIADEEELSIVMQESDDEDPPAETPETDPEIPVLTEEDLALAELQNLNNAVQALRTKTENCMVNIYGLSQEQTWMDSSSQLQSAVTGMMIADNHRSLLILTEYEPLKDAENIVVVFPGGSQASGSLTAWDSNTGLAVVSVILSHLDPAIRYNLDYAALGTSLGKKLEGQFVLALGAPTGTVGSMGFGYVTSQGATMNLRDSYYKKLTTDIAGNNNSRGVLVNLNGEVVGILHPDENGETNTLTAIGISELKRTIERLSNGNQMAYFGVHGAEIAASVRTANELPSGAYITSVEINSPAMTAGIQSGDFIISVNGVEIISYSELASAIVQSSVGDTLTVMLARQSQDSYQTMQVSVLLTEQP